MDAFDWVDKQEEKVKAERSKDYFNIIEGKQNFVLLSHCAPLAQVWSGNKYRAAEEGDRNISIKGVCWVLQSEDGIPYIKQAKMPYSIVRSIRELQQNPEWEFELPFPHTLTLGAKNAGTKEVEYSLTPSPKKIVIPAEILEELKKKPTPEEIVEKIKGKADDTKVSPSKSGAIEYPTEDINPDDIPF